ncbi:MAG: ABC transporter substrate-binding protein [Chloroflexi bacterium]|nr:ABC transporter substrate-binding protein [Chloroflexota bacterium]
MNVTTLRALALILTVAATACSTAPTSAVVTATGAPATSAATTAKPPPTTAPVGGAGPTAAPAPPKPQAAASGKVTFAYSQDFNTLDPALISATNEFSLMKSVDPGLVARNAKGEYVPGLAESWNQMDDLTWDFKLRKGMTFQDGTPVDAKAIKFNIDRLSTPDIKGRAQFPTSVFLDHVDAVDDVTVRFVTTKLAATMPLELYNLGMGSPKWFQDAQPADIAKHPVGAGPFKFVEWQKDDHLTLEAWDGYWGQKPSIKTIVFRVIPEVSSRIAELETGGIDIADLIPPDQINRVQSIATADVRNVQTGSRAYLVYRSDTAPFTDTRVRQALNYAVNWDVIKKSLLNDAGERLAGVVVAPNNSPDVKSYPYDMAKSKQLLSDAGLPNGFSTTLTVPCGRYVRDKDIAQAIASDLGKVGVQADVQCVESSAFIKKLFTDKDPYPLYYLALSSAFDAQSDLTNLSPTFPLNPSKWTNDQFLKLYDQLVTTRDQAQRKSLSAQLQQVVHDDPPYLFLWQQFHWYGVNKKLDWTARPDEYVYFDEAVLH